MTLITRTPSIYNFHRLAPTWLIEKLNMKDDHIHYNDFTTQTYLETPGDLKELWDLLKTSTVRHNDQELESIANIFEFTMRAYGVLTIEEYRDIPTIVKFQESYPNLSRTFEVWAWS